MNPFQVFLAELDKAIEDVRRTAEMTQIDDKSADECSVIEKILVTVRDAAQKAASIP